MPVIDEWQYHCSNTELTPDLVNDIRHFPVRQTLLQDLSRTLYNAKSVMDLARLIPSLVCTFWTDDILILF